MQKKYFKTKEKIKEKYDSNRARKRAAAEAEKKRWLSSPEYKEAVNRIDAANLTSAKYALDYDVVNKKYEEFTNWLAERNID